MATPCPWARPAAVALALLATPCVVHGQTVDAATVTDPAGRPIALAQISVTTNRETREVYSDEQGRFPLDPALWTGGGDVRLTISSLGYADLVVLLAKPIDAAQPFRLSTLQPETADILVVARTLSKPFSPKTINFLDIVTNANAKGDPLLAVNTLPASTNVLGNARLTLRGNRASINRTYLNTTPVYEFATGSEFDNTTQGRSIFNLSVGNDIEVYPANPPSYLAGASGGAVRLITPTSATKAGVLSVSTLGVNAAQTVTDTSGGDFLTVYGGLTDLALHKAINPGLDTLIDKVRSASGGALARKALASGGEVTGFFQAETGDDVFPFSIGGMQTRYTLRPSKARLALDMANPLGDWVLNASLAYTRSRTKEGFGAWFARSTNQYGFGSLNLVGQPFGKALTVRVGTDGEIIDQTSLNNSSAFGSITAPVGSARRQDNRRTVASMFGFATYRVGPQFEASLGARQILLSNARSGTSLQASGAFTSTDRHHKLIVSLGRYAGWAVPTQAYFGPIARSLSRQIELNYAFVSGGVNGGIAGYYASEESDGQVYDPVGGAVFTDNLTGIERRTKTKGVEVYANASFLNRLKAGLSYVIVRQDIDLVGRSVRGANDFPTILRANLGYVAPPKTSIDLSWTWRSGEPFTEVVGLAALNGRLLPSYGSTNGRRRPSYSSVDVSASYQISPSSLKIKPLLFVSLSNVLNCKNPSSQLLTIPFQRDLYRNLPGRVLALGLVVSY